MGYGSERASAPPCNDMSQMWNAAYDGEENTVKRLVAGATAGDLNWSNNWGQTALFIASKNGHAGTVRILLDAGADVSIMSKGKTALDIARETKRGEIVDMLQAFINKKAAEQAASRTKQLSRQPSKAAVSPPPKGLCACFAACLQKPPSAQKGKPVSVAKKVSPQRNSDTYMSYSPPPSPRRSIAL